jgi:hypothetical protein
LVFVLGLDVFIELDVLHGLVLDILVHRLLDGALQLIIVIYVLDHIVDSILEALDVSVVIAYLIPVCFDDMLHLRLAVTKIIDNLT